MPGARRRWGWYELSPEWADRLVAWSEVGPGDLVLDVGAGRGVITASLLEAGARVIAVELHAQRAALLRDRFGDAVTVVRTDAADLRLPRRPFHVVANPPYSISSALMRRLVSSGSRLESAHLVLQTQTATRWSSTRAPGGNRWRRTFDVTTGPRIPRGAFDPAPRVESRLLVFRRRRTVSLAAAR